MPMETSALKSSLRSWQTLGWPRLPGSLQLQNCHQIVWYGGGKPWEDMSNRSSQQCGLLSPSCKTSHLNEALQTEMKVSGSLDFRSLDSLGIPAGTSVAWLGFFAAPSIHTSFQPNNWDGGKQAGVLWKFIENEMPLWNLLSSMSTHFSVINCSLGKLLSTFFWRL